MKKVTPNKNLGQHFLIDELIIDKIINAVDQYTDLCKPILEIGPGVGAITKHLYKKEQYKCIEVDNRCIAALKETYPNIETKIIHADFLQVDLRDILTSHSCLVGNFPYNISSQIVFKVLENKEKIDVVIGMFQREVANRICADKKGKDRGVITMLSQLYYDSEKLFDISPQAFDPPPQVFSSVIVMKRTNKFKMDFNVKLYKRLVKVSYNQRRKMIRNTLKRFYNSEQLKSIFFQKRPEELGVADFITLTKWAEKNG